MIISSQRRYLERTSLSEEPGLKAKLSSQQTVIENNETILRQRLNASDSDILERTDL